MSLCSTSNAIVPVYAKRTAASRATVSRYGIVTVVVGDGNNAEDTEPLPSCQRVILDRMYGDTAAMILVCVVISPPSPVQSVRQTGRVPSPGLPTHKASRRPRSFAAWPLYVAMEIVGATRRHRCFYTHPTRPSVFPGAYVRAWSWFPNSGNTGNYFTKCKNQIQKSLLNSKFEVRSSFRTTVRGTAPRHPPPTGESTRPCGRRRAPCCRARPVDRRPEPRAVPPAHPGRKSRGCPTRSRGSSGGRT